MNITRLKWNFRDSEEINNDNKISWKLFNSMNLFSLHQTELDKDSFQNRKHTLIFLRHYKLSNEIMTLLIKKELSNRFLKINWSLNFNTSDGPMLNSRRVNMKRGLIINNRQMSWATYKNYVFRDNDVNSTDNLLSVKIMKSNTRGLWHKKSLTTLTS